MLIHWSEVHRGEEKPRFNQFVISSYKSCLEMQIGEEVRIQLRRNVLNSVGVYNRSKLTRLVVDSEWDKRVFNSNWTQDNKDLLDIIGGGEAEESIEEKERGTKRSKERQSKSKKRNKSESEPEITWGEQLKGDKVQMEQKQKFLYKTVKLTTPSSLKQTVISPTPISALVSTSLVMEMVRNCIVEVETDKKDKELMDLIKVMEDDSEWLATIDNEIENAILEEQTSIQDNVDEAIAKEIDEAIAKEIEKKAKAAAQKLKLKKKLTKKDKLKIAAKSSRKITSFFMKSQNPSKSDPPVPMEVDVPEVDSIIEMEVDKYTWQVRDRLIYEREKGQLSTKSVSQNFRGETEGEKRCPGVLGT